MRGSASGELEPLLVKADQAKLVRIPDVFKGMFHGLQGVEVLCIPKEMVVVTTPVMLTVPCGVDDGGFFLAGEAGISAVRQLDDPTARQADSAYGRISGNLE